MQEGISPEEKLLKHIRKQPAPALAHEAFMKPAASMHESGLLHKEEDKSILPFVDKILILIVLGLLGYTFYQFSFVKKDIGLILNDPRTKSEGAQTQEVALENPKPLSVYTDRINMRDIFDSSGSNTKDIKIMPGISELTKNLRLVGIVLGQTPEAIIEDVETNETLFVQVGETVKGATVEQIQEGKVIFLYEDQRIELVQ